ncbi:MAG: glycosyltransferase family 2 protein [Chloroflexi bacterium]|nr:glycosyltransferase family 2 protein [Chloroflexota bacterium]
MRTVTVIIPLWNGEKWIRSCLAALAGQCTNAPFALEAVVVDNGSQDTSPAIVTNEFPAARLIRNGRNLGFAGGCNVGLAAATGDVLVLLNQDTLVQPGWLAGLMTALQEPGVGVAGSLALLADGATIQHAGGLVEWPLGVARHRGYGEALGDRWRQPGDAAFVTGASLALRRDVLDRVGPLDEGFWPGYYEDVDFCWRVREAGYSVCYAPDSTLIHAESGSFTDSAYTAWARLRGRLRFCLKHLSAQRFVDEFLPAETDYQPVVLAGDRHGQIARAYLEAIPMAFHLWRARGEDAERIAQAIAGLSQLCPPLEAGLGPPADIPRPGEPLLTPSPLDRLPVLGEARRALHQLVIFYSERRQQELLSLIQTDREYIRRLETEIALRQKKLSE